VNEKEKLLVKKAIASLHLKKGMSEKQKTKKGKESEERSEARVKKIHCCP